MRKLRFAIMEQHFIRGRILTDAQKTLPVASYLWVLHHHNMSVEVADKYVTFYQRWCDYLIAERWIATLDLPSPETVDEGLAVIEEWCSVGQPHISGLRTADKTQNAAEREA